MMKVFSVDIATLVTLLICALPVKCRQAVKPSDDIEVTDKTKLMPNVPETFSAAYGEPCRLNVQEDLPKPNDPQPLYIIPNTNKIWYPDRYGYLVIPAGASIELFCTSSFEFEGKTIPKNTKMIQPNCARGKIFTWRGEKYEFKQFVCKEPVKFVVEQKGGKCSETGELYRVGHTITQNRFIENMRICYDNEIWRNHYTRHRLIPGSVHFQRHVDRIRFSKAGFFGAYNVNSYYTQQNQLKQAAQLFSSNATISKLFNMTANMYLARGHLAAKADFIYANQQRATFIFFNVAPQWQSFNAGHWGTLEEEVRKYVMSQNLDVDCYTGTWDTLNTQQLDAKAQPRDFYLSHDGNNNGILPVPKYYYRVIIDRNNTRRGIALVGVNNPYATMKDILGSYIICDDKASDIPWLHWIRNRNLHDGYLYACAVAQFSRVVTVLPRTFRNVIELLA